MALSDLAVYSEYAYKSMTEVLRQKIELFNSASANALTLTSAANQGDFNEAAFFAKISGGTVRRRNAYGSGSVSEKVPLHNRDISVKVAAGTPPIRLDEGQFKWIQMNPKVAGAAVGQQIAKDTLADMVNTGLAACYAAMSQITALITNVSAATAPADLPSWVNMNTAQAKFGDRSSEIAVWIMHSAPMHKLWENNLNNTASLFSYGTVKVISDPFGKPLIMTDSPALIAAGSPNVYRILGLTPGSINVEQNNDFTDNMETKNGSENIIRTYQSEWSYNLSIKGFRWDKTNGGASPNDAALTTATNWDRYATDDKDMPGVVLVTH